MKKYYIWATFFLFIFNNAAVQAQAQSDFSPQKFLGYTLGQHFTPHHKVVAYFEQVAQRTNTVKLQTYGSTPEQRNLVVAFVSSAKNIANLAQLQANNLALVNQDNAPKTDVVFVWLSYNVHGNEAAGTEAAMQVLYELSLAQNDSINTWLDHVVVAIDPCQNPDGRDRYVNWYQQHVGAAPNPNLDAVEHKEPFPSGRFNHYLFDLNRDWAWQTQTESQARVAIYRQYMPQVHVDLHEMGVNEPYFFGPAAEPMHHTITNWQKEYQKINSENLAKTFDKNGWLYFSNEIFDLLYPSYGDTYPTFNGAVGFTFEQGGSGQAGIAATAQNGELLTLAQRTAHHVQASLATVETAYKNRTKLIEQYADYFLKARNNPQTDYKSYVVLQNANTNTLLQLLDKNGIQYSFLPKSNLTGYDYFSQKTMDFSTQEGDVFINAAQPMANMVRVLFEPKTVLNDSLTYDLTAWCMAYAYNVPIFALKNAIDSPTKKPNTADFTQVLQPSYAYIFGWNAINDAAFLGNLLQEKIQVRFAKQPFTYQNKTWQQGTLVVTQADNLKVPDFAKKLQAICTKNKVLATAIAGAWGVGGVNFGSGSFELLAQNAVAMVTGEGTNPTSVGEVWHFFEQDLKMPVTILSVQSLNNTNLSAYNTLILPAGSYEKSMEKLLDFADKGGNLIVLEQAIDDFAATDKTALGKANMGEKEADKDQNDVEEPYNTQERSALSEVSAGSIYKISLDATHPLAFGLGNKTFCIKNNSNTYKYLKNGANLGYFSADAHVSGFVGYKLKANLSGSLAIGSEQYGDGRIVYFTDSPIFRGFWQAGKLSLANAIFLK